MGSSFEISLILIDSLDIFLGDSASLFLRLTLLFCSVCVVTPLFFVCLSRFCLSLCRFSLVGFSFFETVSGFGLFGGDTSLLLETSISIISNELYVSQFRVYGM
jgi:hypothetical protein